MSTFINNLLFPSGVTYKIYEADGIREVTSGNIVTGMKLKIVAKYGVTSKTYIINVLKNTNTTIGSKQYSINNTNNSIINVPFATSTYSFLNNIILPAGARDTLYNSDGRTVVTSGNIATGMKLKVVAEDSITSKIFSINVIKSSNTAISSKQYSIDNINNSISNVQFGTPTYSFLKNMTLPIGASYTFYNNDGNTLVTSGNIVTGMKLKVIAQDGTTSKIYVLKVNKNTDVSISSKKYIIDSVNKNIKDVSFNTSIESFMKDIVLPFGASYAVYESDGIKLAQCTSIVRELKLKVTAEDGVTTKYYNILVKKDSCPGIYSTKYTIDNSNLVISNIPYGATIYNFKDNIIWSNRFPYSSAQYMLYKSDGKTSYNLSTLVDGLIVKVAAKDGNIINYTLRVNKNSEASIISTGFSYKVFAPSLYKPGTYSAGIYANYKVDRYLQISSLMSGLRLSEGATMKLYKSDGITEVTSGKIEQGMIVVITSQDKINTKKYTIYFSDFDR